MRIIGATLAWLAVITLPAQAQQETQIGAIKDARIITVSGAEIPRGTILIKDGRIEAVGPDLEVPWNARVIEAKGKVVIPGWVEAHSSSGLDRPNERVASVPFVTVYDSINPVAAYFEDALRRGTTSIFIMPGNGGMIGGRGVIVRPVGLTVEEMAVVRDAAMKISLQPASRRSKMAHMAALRKEFDDIRDYLKSLKEKTALPVSATPRKVKELDVKRKPMADLIEGRLPAFIYCPTASDVVRAHELATTYGIKATYVVSSTAWRAVDYIKKNDLNVVLDANLVYWDSDEETREQFRRIVPKIFHDAGVRFALQTSTGGGGRSEMWFQVATCVKYGIPRDEAIKAATLYPAQMMGMEKRLGSIEKGKDANFQILSGDPLDVMTWVEKVVIEGNLVYDRDKDTKLKRLLGEDK